MRKSDRQKVFEKYGGKCAYSGLPLETDWQVDHIVPKNSHHWLLLSVGGSTFDVNHIDNLVPATKILNHYKRAKDLEEWRQYLLTLHIRLAKLPKKTRVEKRKKYKEYMLTVANCFGITTDNQFLGKFYFELINSEQNDERSVATKMP